MHNFFNEAKKELGISGKISEMAGEIDRIVTRKAKELARQYINETVLFNDDGKWKYDPDTEVHYKISWGSQHHDEVNEVWEDAVFKGSEWTGIYCKNLTNDDECDEFEYIKEIEKINKEQQ